MPARVLVKLLATLLIDIEFLWHPLGGYTRYPVRGLTGTKG